MAGCDSTRTQQKGSGRALFGVEPVLGSSIMMGLEDLKQSPPIRSSFKRKEEMARTSGEGLVIKRPLPSSQVPGRLSTDRDSPS